MNPTQNVVATWERLEELPLDFQYRITLGTAVFALRVGGVLVGILRGFWEAPEQFYLESFEIRTYYQGQGYGTLMWQLFQQAYQGRHYEVTGVAAPTAQAMGFWRRQGATFGACTMLCSEPAHCLAIGCEFCSESARMFSFRH